MADKRKDLMDDIKSRLDSGAYDMARYAKNEKDLREKVKFFEKKAAAGELKGYMASRLDVARALLARVRALKSGDAAAAAPAPVLPNLAPPAERVFNAESPGFRVNMPTAAPAAAPAKAKRARTVKKKNNKPVTTLSNVPNMPPPQRKKTVRLPREPVEEVENEHLVRAIEEKGKIPELYDPYTGVKFEPEEDPFPPVERAYKELVKLRRNVYRLAQNYRTAARMTRKVSGSRNRNGSGSRGRNRNVTEV